MVVQLMSYGADPSLRDGEGKDQSQQMVCVLWDVMDV